MTKKIVRKKSSKEMLASVKSEMSEPRVSRSARHETVEQGLDRIAKNAAKV